MKKTTLIISFSLITLSFIYSQEVKFGVKGGVNFNSIGKLYHIGTANGGGIGVIPSEDTYYDSDEQIATHFGLFIMIAFDKFFIRSEINSMSLKNSYPLSQKTSNWTASKIDIPILFGIKIYEPISIYAGPVFSNISDMNLEGVESPITFNKTSTDVSVGLLAEFGRFGVDIRYQYTITTIKDQRIDIVRAIYGTNVAYLLEYNPSQLSIGVHINIVKFNGLDKRNRSKSNWHNHKNL